MLALECATYTGIRSHSKCHSHLLPETLPVYFVHLAVIGCDDHMLVVVSGSEVSCHSDDAAGGVASEHGLAPRFPAARKPLLGNLAVIGCHDHMLVVVSGSEVSCHSDD